MNLDRHLDSRMTSARLIGGLFLAGFLFYGIGFALVTSVVDKPNFLMSVPDHRATLLVGVFLMLVNTVVDVGKGVLFFPILERHSRRAALMYLATMIIEVVLLAAGALLFLSLLPLADQSTSASWATGVSELVVKANDSAYQLAELLLGLGCLAMTAVLLQSGLVPRLLAGWGLLGYALLAVGSAADLIGAHVGLALSIPGGLFELALGGWLMAKGFEPTAYAEPHDATAAELDLTGVR